MKKLLFAFVIFVALKGNAQTYLISFTGTGASNTVNTVKVANLIAGTSVTLNGGDILRLSSATGVYPIENGQSHDMKIYPNPTSGNSTFEVSPPVAGEAIISVYEMTGKPVARLQSYLENYKQEFRLSGIKSGFYLINVNGNNYQYSGKLLCNGQTEGTISIEKINNNKAVAEIKSKSDNKGAQATVDMAYTAGDRLKFTGISGNYSTVMTDIPASDKTVTFNFIACSDGVNNYPVVKIDNQVWMAENLKTTKYNDGLPIDYVPDNTAYGALITGAYCWYDNDEATYKNVYGAIYNWYTVNTGKLCPTGWHVPTDVDWTTLTTYLGGESVAGAKLKETGTSHWHNINVATNESGFTALPGGYRALNGFFSVNGYYGFWWTSSEYPANWAWSRYLFYDYTEPLYSGVTRNYMNLGIGYSVRCIKD